MSQHPQLQYHNAILELLNVVPTFSDINIELIRQREEACKTTFPISVKEWFSLEGCTELFREYTNQDELVHNYSFDVDEISKISQLGDPEETSQGWLRVAVENQGVVRWYVPLGGSDDPPVFNDNDSYCFAESDDDESDEDFEWKVDLSKIDWVLDSVTFTNFIFDMLSNNCWKQWYTGMRLCAKSQAPTVEQLHQLRSLYREGPRTESSDISAFRFYNKHCLIVIHTRKGEKPETEWIIGADGPQSLYHCAKSVWHFHDLAKCFRQVSSKREAVSHIIERLQKDTGKDNA